MHPVTSISILGLHAQRFVERHASARVVAAFSRSLHLESDGDFICIGDPSIGRGPLNAELGHAGWMRLAAALPPIGTSVRIAKGAVRIGGLALDTTCAELWRPAAWPSAASGEEVLQALEEGREGHKPLARIDDLPLFGATAPKPKVSEVEEALKTVEPDALTPKQALELLYDLKRKQGAPS